MPFNVRIVTLVAKINQTKFCQTDLNQSMEAKYSLKNKKEAKS
jgi:hypothetical protein